MVGRTAHWYAAWLGFALALVVWVMAFPIPAARASASIGEVESGVVARIPVFSGIQLFPPVYDGENGDLYAPAWSGPNSNGTLNIVSGVSNSLVGQVTVGWEPDSVTVDPSNEYVYVANFAPGCGGSCPPDYWQAPGNLSVISGTTNSPLTSIQTWSNPSGVTYDPANGDLYVPNSNFPSYTTNGTPSVSVISGSTNRVQENVTSVTFDPSSIYYNGANGDLYVMDQRPYEGPAEPNHITVLSGANAGVVGNMTLSCSVYGGMIFDNVSGDWYAGTTNGLSIISGVTNSVVANLPVDNLFAGFVNPEGDLYFLQPGSPAQIYEISGTTNSVESTFSVGSANWMGYDNSDEDIYTTSSFSGVVNVTSAATREMIQSIDVGAGFEFNYPPTYDPSNGNLYLSSTGDTSDIVVISGNTTVGAPPTNSVLPWVSLSVGVTGGVIATAIAVVIRRRRERGAPFPAITP